MEIKTTMATCPNGHHYDGAKHASCPFCGAVPGTENLGAASAPLSR